MKRQMTLRLMPIVLFFIALPLVAQQVMPASRWQVSQAVDLGTGQIIDYHGTFVVTADAVNWQQRNQTADYLFTVTGGSGAWADLAADGTAVLDILFRGRPGTITFSKKGDTSLIRIRVNSGIGAEIFPFQFLTDTIQKI